ncbi:MAG: NADPH dehydrogenase [Firmicutes bacterium GWF2_51_9]|nr:NADPH dehydrogenase NamA [Erysipelotrichaceae bacterium]OGS54562.1 MAG: NADPH dehydrogenase [Firmicutes bacterium GWF2_51_9]OGS59537.1 MAG: NADPH dehydrogenase [Firmicutes bacterium GWE2_51_13]HAM63092.1 NADPH dehydrogenase NamA [Erysipelotrichaceae bacterium]HBZ41163.1 NADPH dehydrogenase NamA [Erysipelotrichaceae bacterium]
MKITESYQLKNLTLPNRLVMPPMCMYQAKDGFADNFHFTHYTTTAFGKVGMIIIEATGVTAGGRISDGDLGLWDDKFIPALKEIVDEVHRNGSKIGIQLIHAGRKSEAGSYRRLAPSAIAHSERYAVPEEMTKEDIDEVIKAFGQAARRADEAGFDIVEIHGAHGYLIHEFMSPLSNLRKDTYGGSTENRGRFLAEVIDEVKKYWPSEKVLQVRVSASDWDENGLDVHEVGNLLLPLKNKIDLVHVSSGGNVNRAIPLKPGYQVEFAHEIKQRLDLPVIAVGLITSLDQVEEILSSGKADLVALGRELLRNPFWMFEAYAKDNQLDRLISSYARAYRER